MTSIQVQRPGRRRDQRPADRPPTAAGVARSVPRWRRRPRRPALAIILLVAAAVGAGTAWGALRQSPTVLAGPEPHWPAVIAGLDAVRDAALRTGDAGLLRSAHTATGASVTADLALLSALSDADLHPGPTQPEILEVRQLSGDGDRATLEVLDRLPAIDLVAGDGRQAATQAARPERRWRVELIRVGGSWRYESVSAVPAADPRPPSSP